MAKLRKVAVVARDPSKVIDLKKDLTDFEYDEKNPDFVVSFGGDGTYLVAERLYPGIPKLLAKDSDTCVKCHEGEIYHIISKILREKYVIEDYIKLETVINKKKWLCTNNFVVRNKLPTHALRFYVKVDGKQINELIIGDGVVFATPFGSTAYHHSISRKSFDKGIGIAFNNPTKPVKHLVVKEDSKVEFELVRGDCVFASDNDPEIIDLIEGQVISIKKAKDVAKIIKIKEH